MNVRRTSARWIAALALLLAAPIAAEAEEHCPCPPPAPPPPLWTGSLGFSVLATSGNTDSESLGFTTEWLRQPTPWGVEIRAAATSAEADGVQTAERYQASVRGKRLLSERFDLFGGVAAVQDEFAGIDLRALVEAGGVWKAAVGPVHELAFDGGLTWTSEDFVIGESADYFGAVAGAAYVWHISERAALRERLLWYPSFEESDDWRVSSETVLEAALASSWAVRVGYLYLRDNLPAPGFEKSDSTTSVSIVWKR